MKQRMLSNHLRPRLSLRHTGSRYSLGRLALLLTLTLVLSGFVAWLRPTRAQAETPVPVLRVGILQLVEHPALDASRKGFLDRLSELGYVEGENLRVNYANAQGEQATAQTIAEQFAGQDLDLILAIATPAAQAVANRIKDTPILVTAVTDPEASGLVHSNEAPGGNLSGTSDLSPITEQIELLHTLVPEAKHVGILYASSEANSRIQGDLAIEALNQLGLTSEVQTASASNELQQVVESVIGKVDAIYIPTDNMFANAVGVVAQVTQTAKVPVIVGESSMVEAGTLGSVSLDYYKLGQQTADMAQRIFEEGADPATMPIEYQKDPEIVVNVEVASHLGVDLPTELGGRRIGEVGDPSESSSSSPPSGLRDALVSGITQGIIWAIMALGVYITFRLLKVSDLTVDGSFTTGGAVTAVAIHAGVHPAIACLLALLAGMFAGSITGFLTTRMKIPTLLASILTQIALYSINLRIMGGPNIPLLNLTTLFTGTAQHGALSLLLALAIVILTIALMYMFFGTEVGAAIRATGANPRMVRALGTHTDTTTLLGLMLANGLVAFSGSLVAQQQGYADIGMGTGAIVIGLAAIVIGEALFLKKNFWLRLSGVVLGSIVYRVIITFVLRWDPIQASDLKLFTAVIVAIALFLPEALQSSKQKLHPRRNHHA